MIAVLACAVPAAGRAEDDAAAEAKRQYDLGTQAYAAHRFVEAALAFEAAAAYKPNAITLYTAALAWDQAHQPERAADAFGRALELTGLSQQQRENAKERLAVLEKAMGTLIVTGPEGTRVQIDALTETSLGPLGARLHATPGAHTLTARVPGEPPEKRDVTFELGETQALHLTKKQEIAPPTEPGPSPAPPASLPPSSAGLSVRHLLGMAALGAGGAAALATVVLGASALDAKSAYEASPSRATYDHAIALAAWTNVAWITGAVFVAGGVTLFLWPERKDAPQAVSVLPGPGSIALRGTF
jgi:tetratricopeptide (TPR) repeat protein